MNSVLRDCEELIQVDEALWLLTATAGVPAYDFPFARYFPFERYRKVSGPVEVVARIGAPDDYAARFEQLSGGGIRLVNSVDEHLRASRLPCWYPLLEDLTPRSRWYDVRPTAGDVATEFAWPVFVKGERQTDHHRRGLSIARNAEEFDRIMAEYAEIPLLAWQRVTVRRFETLRPIEDVDPQKIPSSFEFRSFWWRGELVGLAPYWFQGKSYRATEAERAACTAVGREAARRVEVPFLVVDLAQTVDGRWIVIECNDAQESGYAGVNPLGLWQQVIALERAERG